jgi:hypothetical protein
VVLASWRFCERGSFFSLSGCLSELDTQHWASGPVILDSEACHSKVREGSSLPVPRGGEEAADPVPTVYRPFCQKRRTVFYPEDPTLSRCTSFLFLFLFITILFSFSFFFPPRSSWYLLLLLSHFLLNYCHYIVIFLIISLTIRTPVRSNSLAISSCLLLFYLFFYFLFFLF